jgi:hypothetical protein
MVPAALVHGLGAAIRFPVLLAVLDGLVEAHRVSASSMFDFTLHMVRSFQYA